MPLLFLETLDQTERGRNWKVTCILIWSQTHADYLAPCEKLSDKQPIDGFHGVWLHFQRARVGICV